MGIETYRTSPANNGSVLATGTMVEGMSPGLVNDSMRQIAADLRNFYNDPFFIEYGIGDGATTYTRVNGTSFTLPANVIDDYHVGRRIKLLDGTATTLYGTITSSTFSSPNTTVNVSFDGGSQIGSGTITSVKVGIQAVNSPAPTNIQTGGIIMWTTSSIPNTWLLADGSLVSKTTYAALWNAIGSTYGTPSATQFYLPNLADKFVVGKGSTYALGATGGASTLTPSGSISTPSFSGSSSGVSGSISISGTTGSTSLTTAQIPSHSHLMIHNTSATTNGLGVITLPYIGRGNVGGMGSSDYGLQGSSGTPNVGSTANTGSGSGHTHSFSTSASISGGTTTASGSVSTPNFTGSSASIINPYLALSYIIKA